MTLIALPGIIDELNDLSRKPAGENNLRTFYILCQFCHFQRDYKNCCISGRIEPHWLTE